MSFKTFVEGFFTSGEAGERSASEVMNAFFKLERNHPGRYESFMYHFGSVPPEKMQKRGVRQWIETHMKSLLHGVKMGDVNWESVYQGVIRWAQKKNKSR